MASDSQLGNGSDQHIKRYYQHSPKTVALVCMGPSVTDYLTATLTQEFDRKWVDEVWLINMACNSFRGDLIIWMDDLVSQHKFRPKLIEAVNDFKTPVLTSKSYPDLVPLSYDYPIDEVCQAAVPIFGKPYLNNGVAMAVAYAMLKGVKKLAIYGADFSYPNRDFAESGRACVEAWITLAGGLGMEIMLCQHTSLMDSVKDHGIYGYAEQPEITLPDGMKFKYVKQSETMGKYIPENSVGAPNGIQNQEQPSGAGDAAGASGAAGGQHPPVAVPQHAPSPVARLGESLRAKIAGRPHEGGDLALHDSSGRHGHLPEGPDQPVLLAARSDRP